MTISAITKVIIKVNIYLYINKIVLTAKIAEYKLEVTHSALNIIIVIRIIGLAIKPSQTMVATQSVEL